MNKITLVILAWRFLLREWRAGELKVLGFSLILAVAAITSVGFFTDRINRALSQQANELLGADVLIQSDHKLAEKYFDLAEQHQLKHSLTVAFPSMAVSEDSNHLGMLKAVDHNYPLRGSLHIANELFSIGAATQAVPAVDEVWLEARMLTALNVNVGDTISIGASQFIVKALITAEPGRGGDMFSIAPRLLINREALPTTELVQPASRVKYNLLVAGDEANIDVYRQTIEKFDEAGVSILGVRDSRPEVRTALTRADQFLGLAAITSVILAGIAIALAARRFAQRHLDHCAIMRCIGADQKSIFSLYLLQMMFLGLIASLLGCVVGYIAHLFLLEVLGALVGVQLPAPSLWPLFAGVAIGLVTLLGFALAPLLQLNNVPALRVLRRDLGAIQAQSVWGYVLGIATLCALILLQTADLKLGAYVVGGLVAAFIVLALVASACVYLLRFIPHRNGSSYLHGLINLRRRPVNSVIQVSAFGLGLTILLLLTIIRVDLLNEWQHSIPEDAPNRFVINVQLSQVEDMKQFFAQHQLGTNPIYPMIRGRLISINDDLLKDQTFSDERAKNLAEREFNLSYAADMAEGNILLQGEWWSEDQYGQELLSVEEGIADTLNMSMGDELVFEVAGERFKGKISNLRKVDWDSFRPNFFVMAVPGLIDELPSTSMTSFYLAPDRFQVLNEMIAQFPNVTVIDIAAIMQHIRDIISRVSLAVEYVFFFTLLTGVMVLYAGIQATHDERLLENAIMRTLGADKKQIMQALWAEFICVGILAGLVAAFVATGMSYVISDKILNMPFNLNLNAWLVGVLGGALGVGVAGVLGSRSVVSQPPLQTLRKLSL